MKAEFHKSNRESFYRQMKPGSLLALFSGTEIRKTNDEYYPFFTDRDFYYMTGLDSKQFALVAGKDGSGKAWERVYILPPDLRAERWTGRRIKPDEVFERSGIEDVRFVTAFEAEIHALMTSGRYENVYLDLYRASADDIDRPAHGFLRLMQKEYPFLKVENANAIIRRLRTIKQPCELEAMRRAEKITGEGIMAMMKASRPGMYEYQYKAEFDYVLNQYSAQGSGFPSIVSAGKNNFCIHYYSYTGQAQDGDMILNDVGAQWDSVMTDVSRGFPCNGRFSDRQKLLYNCALQTSNHMFSIIRPGFLMEEVDAEIKRFNYSLLHEAGLLKSFDEIGKLMWHGGAHHVGYDVHDVVERPEKVAPGMVFCIDVGIYNEDWGIGFRLEDNCLVTENGCENLSAAIPRTVEDIEAVMRNGGASWRK